MATLRDDTDELSALRSQLDQERQRADALNAELRQAYAQNSKLARRLKKTRTIGLILSAPVLVLAAPILVPAYIVIRRRRVRKTRSVTQPSFVASKFVALIRPPRLRRDAEMAARPDTFALVRVIGNDLIPRHARGQSATNLRYILETEPDLPNCTKHWVVNRIVDPEQEREILALLEAHGQDFIRLPFDQETYARIGYDHDVFPHPGYVVSPELAQLDDAQQLRARIQYNRLRNNYVINNNGARNAALDIGQRAAKWALPWDGNCFVSKSAWHRIRADIAADPEKHYFSVPMIRLASNDDALADQPPEAATEEPQIIFRADAGQRFDERFPYGRRPKVELLARLGVDGPWRRWPNDPWDLTAGAVVADSHLTGKAGHVARLFSGRGDLEKAEKAAFVARGMSRASSILTVLRRLDWQIIKARGFDPAAPALFDPVAIDALASDPERPLARRIRADADAALQRGPFSVIQKTTVPPSGNIHDYWHPAPDWWPNPKTADGLPYVKRDGKPVPGTRLYDADSGKYDRTRLQQLFDDTTALALAWRLTRCNAYRDHAVRLVRTWFTDETTRMTPHVRYAQVRRGHDRDQGAATGILEMKDIYYFLDAVRLLGDAVLSRDLAAWLRVYLQWLTTSDQGLGARTMGNSHGIHYDLQVFAIAAFLGDSTAMLTAFEDSQNRLGQHFDADGRQPYELGRKTSGHDCLFNMQGWVNLYAMFRRTGFRPLALAEAAHLDAGLGWLLSYRGQPWPFQQSEPFDPDRFAPISLFARSVGTGSNAGTAEDAAILAREQRFHPDCGIPIYSALMHDLAPEAPA